MSTTSAQPVDPSVKVATPQAPEFNAEWRISQNLTDRWGDINDFDAANKPLAELQSTPGLLERLREQRWDEITFIARKDGTFGVLFEVEYVSIESDSDEGLLPYAAMVQGLVAQAEQLSREFPQVEFAVPNAGEVREGRPAIWGFVADGVLTAEQRDALGDRLLTFAFGPSPELELDQEGGMRP